MPLELLGPIFIAVFGVVAVGALIYFLVTRRKPRTPPPAAPTTAIPVARTSERREYRAAHSADGTVIVPSHDAADASGGGDGGVA